MATFGVFNLGLATNVMVSENPSEKQYNAFFGYSGVQSLWGGRRGRTISVTGVFAGSTAADVRAIFESLRTLDDGVARTFTDNTGTTYPNVVYVGDAQPMGKYMLADGQVVQPYRATFESRI
jgi:hypothetical protein